MKPSKKADANLRRRISAFKRDHEPQNRSGKRAFTQPGSRKK